jgi:hypothetical protein
MHTSGAALLGLRDTGDEETYDRELARRLAHARNHAEEIQLLVLLGMVEKDKQKRKAPLPVK